MNHSFLYKVIILVIISFSFTSCYEDYLVISSKFESGKINADSSKIVFFHILQASQPPKGISRFPDGGTHHIIYKNVSVYTFDLIEQKIEQIFDFGNLPYSSWIYNTSVQNNSVTFSISPISGWEWSINNSTKPENYISLSEKYMGFYKYNFDSEELSQFKYNAYYPKLSPDENQVIYLKRDSVGVNICYFNIIEKKNKILKKIESNSAFITINWINNENIAYKFDRDFNSINLQTNETELIDEKLILKPLKTSMKEIEELTKHFTFSDWGFNLPNYWQKSIHEYIDDIVLLNGNINYRKAIIQTISSQLTQKDYEDILNRMEKYETSLKGLEKTEYEIYSTDTKELIKYYLEQ